MTRKAQRWRRASLRAREPIDIWNITSFMHHQNRRTLPSHVPRPAPYRGLRGRGARSRTTTPALFSPNERAERRFWEFFTAHIRNPNTRLAYIAAVRRFAEWCERRRVAPDQVEPMVVAAYIEQLSGALSPASVKQHLAALRMLFDWLVVGQVLPFNPASSVRGPKHVVKTGKTPVLSATENAGATRRHRRHDAGRPSRPRSPRRVCTHDEPPGPGTHKRRPNDPTFRFGDHFRTTRTHRGRLVAPSSEYTESPPGKQQVYRIDAAILDSRLSSLP